MWIPSWALTWENLSLVFDPHPETYAGNWPSWKNGGFPAETQEAQMYENVPLATAELSPQSPFSPLK